MDISEILFSARRCLWGSVTPNIRAVYVKIESQMIILIFYYEHPPSEDEEELASIALCEFSCDFSEIATNFVTKSLPYPKPIPSEGYCVYKRYEPKPL